MSEEDIKKVFKDSTTVHIEDHARNAYEYFMEGMRERASLEFTRITEQLLFYDIIEIYKGRFKNYKDYYEYVVDYNIKCRENNNNPVKSGGYNYLFSYMPERRLLLDRNFEFIKNLNPISYCEKRAKK
jgi:hypothetical protein